MNVTEKLIDAHCVRREHDRLDLRMDQTLTQDATGTLVMLELEALDIDRVQTELSVQYVDHNLLQADSRNASDHLFLRSACRRYGLQYCRPGSGVSHPVHQQFFGAPGKTLIGSDSHTPAAGALGMLAIGAGGLDVALAMAGRPYRLPVPKVWGIELTGTLPDWLSAKDIILTLLKRHGVRGGIGYVLEYHGEGLEQLSVWDRHVIANMGTELGATSSCFPADAEVRRFLQEAGREADWQEIKADSTDYDRHDSIDLSSLEPLIALPGSPGNVVGVQEVAGRRIQQSYIGSSANPGYRDFAVVAEILRDRQVARGVSLDINPSTRHILGELMRSGQMNRLLAAGARLHQTGCNGCIGMGQAPARDHISLRTVPRNFPGRSGTDDDQVYLCSPETAAASALHGVITDPRELALDYPGPEVLQAPEATRDDTIETPPSMAEARDIILVKGDNISTLPDFSPLPETLTLPVLLTVEDDISTDEILAGGSEVLPLRSNIESISQYCFADIDKRYPERATAQRDAGHNHAIIAGQNYGQGSSREHAALAPRTLGLRVVFADSFARIHRQNLINYGVLPLCFASEDDSMHARASKTLTLDDVHRQLREPDGAMVATGKRDTRIHLRHDLETGEIDKLIAGGVLPVVRAELH